MPSWGVIFPANFSRLGQPVHIVPEIAGQPAALPDNRDVNAAREGRSVGAGSMSDAGTFFISREPEFDAIDRYSFSNH
jgi:hypothetical protein